MVFVKKISATPPVEIPILSPTPPVVVLVLVLVVPSKVARATSRDASMTPIERKTCLKIGGRKAALDAKPRNVCPCNKAGKATILKIFPYGNTCFSALEEQN